ncbi:hypothetical protein ACQPW1_48505 [Nocardia sp. CA-128927]|uniref:hypothetical protein n=1 Tax=Nocardia sp. CA-128927 TaxID=3239975 RepID=UPI003D997445
MTRNKHVQIARHAAIVLAGAASLSLTVVAGSYIVHQMAELNRPADHAAPPAQAVEDSTGDAGWADTVLTGGHFELPAVFARHPHDVVVPTPKAADSHPDSAFIPHPSTVGAKLRLGDAYVDAQVGTVRTDTIAITVGTNALTVLTGHQPDDRATAAGVTQLRTEFDTRSGEVVLMLTDPTLGDHDLRLSRNPAPNPKPAPDKSVSTTAPETTATDPATAPGASTHRGAEPTVTV